MAQIEENNILSNYAKHWESIWMKCGRKETALFEVNSIAYSEEVVLLTTRRDLMVWIYYLLRNNKKLKPIEELEAGVKKQMWAFINEICAGRVEDVVIKKRIAMVFYTLEYFINETNG